MKNIITTLCLIFGSLCITAQNSIEIVQTFFKAMSATDTTALSQMLSPSCALSAFFVDDRVEKHTLSGSRQEFLSLVGACKVGELDTRVENIEIKMKDRTGISVATMDYEFYFRGKFSHCGKIVFTLVDDKKKRRIVSISDARDFVNCRHEILAASNLFMDKWHHAATVADSAAYFSKLADESIFVGTDSSEVWTKAQFLSFASPYFAKGKAWDFKKLSRNLHYDAKRSIVWFDEMLDTWMGPCRGSGWLDVSKQPYQIYQYVLSVTVPNDKIKPVIDLLK